MKRRIPWHESEHGGPLGRHVDHDPRNRDHPFVAAAGGRQPVLWRRHAAILDQGELGSCTGNALEGALGTEPLHKRFERHTEKKAVLLYSIGTTLDTFAGEYPPDDTGSSGLAVCKAAVKLERLTAYRWAFGIDHALDALQHGPVITGVDWLEGFDQPSSTGLVKLTGQKRGGHEFVVRGFDPSRNEVLADNSWGKSWGLQGSFRVRVQDWAELLDRQGDVTVPIRG